MYARSSLHGGLRSVILFGIGLSVLGQAACSGESPKTAAAADSGASGSSGSSGTSGTSGSSGGASSSSSSSGGTDCQPTYHFAADDVAGADGVPSPAWSSRVGTARALGGGIIRNNAFKGGQQRGIEFNGGTAPGFTLNNAIAPEAQPFAYVVVARRATAALDGLSHTLLMQQPELQNHVGPAIFAPICVSNDCGMRPAAEVTRRSAATTITLATKDYSSTHVYALIREGDKVFFGADDPQGIDQDLPAGESYGATTLHIGRSFYEDGRRGEGFIGTVGDVLVFYGANAPRCGRAAVAVMRAKYM